MNNRVFLFINIAISLMVVSTIVLICLLIRHTKRKRERERLDTVDGSVIHYIVFDKPASPLYIPAIIMIFLVLLLPLPLVLLKFWVPRGARAVIGSLFGIVASMAQVIIQPLAKQTKGLLMSEYGIHMFSMSGHKWKPFYKKKWEEITDYRFTRKGVQFRMRSLLPGISPVFRLHPVQIPAVEALICEFLHPGLE